VNFLGVDEAIAGERATEVRDGAKKGRDEIALSRKSRRIWNTGWRKRGKGRRELQLY